MADTPRVGAAETPISELLRNIPRDAVYHWENTSKEPWCLPTCSSPVGLLAHRAADALDVLSLSAAPAPEGVAHFGDPCVKCGDAHDEVPIGPCRSVAVAVSVIREQIKWERDGHASVSVPHLHAILFALATRGEAPAEVGVSQDDLAELERVIGTEYYAGSDRLGEALARILKHLRAQPPASEEAQPVGWMMRERDGHMWAYSCDAEDARLAQADGFQCRPLYDTPPAPEAEKLREEARLLREGWAAEAFAAGHTISQRRWTDTDVTADQKAPYRVYVERQLAALQQEGRPDA